MIIKSNALWIGASLALMSSVIPPAMADEWNKRTEFTFNQPVEIPGKALIPGKYVFELADSESNRNIVEIYSEDESGKLALEATLLTIPDFMDETPDEPVIHFDERPSGSPEAIHSWFYPGENTGWAFIYTKRENAVLTATAAPAAAPSEPSAPAANAPAMTAEAAAVAAEDMPEVDLEPAPEEQMPAALAEQEPAAPAQSMDQQSWDQQGIGQQGEADRVLPDTAGNSGALLISGLAMLACGLSALVISRRKVQA